MTFNPRVRLEPIDFAPTGVRRFRVSLEHPGERISDPGGGYIYEWLPCDPPTAFAHIEPATAQQLTRLIAGTLITTATHLVTLAYHPQVTITTRLTFTTDKPHQLYVIHAPINMENRDIFLQLVCSELVGGSVPAERELVDQLKAPPVLTPLTVGG